MQGRDLGEGNEVNEVSGSDLSSFSHSDPPPASRPAGRLHFAVSPSERALVDALRKRFQVRLDGREHAEWTLLDTFDGRFARKGRHLVWLRAVEQSLLALANEGEELADARLVAPLVEPPRFAGELPAGRLRNQVERIAGVRRLHPIARVSEESSRYRIVDDEEKARVRLRFEGLRVQNLRQPDREVDVKSAIQVAEVRGYQPAFMEVVGFFTRDRGLEPVAGDAATRALAALDSPFGPAAKIAVEMAPRDSAARVGLAILRALLEVMKANLAGIRSDSDIEHLHDLRVATRRARTLLKTFRPLLGGPLVDAIGESLAWLGSETGPTRDADVHLLALERASRKLAAEDREALLPLIAFLSERRQRVWKNLIAALDSPRFAHLVEQIDELTDPGGGFARACSESPTIAEFAAQQLAEVHRRLVKRGRKLRRHAPDAAVHRARIEGKRLRYLLEFFQSLYPPNRIEPVIKSIRRLQDELGSFNDAAVQQSVLRELARERVAEGEASAEALVALGRLVERLAGEKERCREGAAKRFTGFDSGANREAFDQLLGEFEDEPQPLEEA